MCTQVKGSGTKMKVYDKEIYNKQESLKTTVIIVIAFLIGVVVGYFATLSRMVENTRTNTNNSMVLNK